MSRDQDSVALYEEAMALIHLRFAEAFRCVQCEQVFERSDRVTSCPQSKDGNHAIVPHKAER